MKAGLRISPQAAEGAGMSKVNFTAGRVHAFSCPEGKAQAFLWDSKVSAPIQI